MLKHPRRLGEASKAASSHSQVRIAKVQRENSELLREKETQQKIIGHLEASSAELRDLVRVRSSGPQGRVGGVS